MLVLLCSVVPFINFALKTLSSLKQDFRLYIANLLSMAWLKESYPQNVFQHFHSPELHKSYNANDPDYLNCPCGLLLKTAVVSRKRRLPISGGTLWKFVEICLVK
jgi:hypothetical protein